MCKIVFMLQYTHFTLVTCGLAHTITCVTCSYVLQCRRIKVCIVRIVTILRQGRKEGSESSSYSSETVHTTD